MVDQDKAKRCRWDGRRTQLRKWMGDNGLTIGTAAKKIAKYRGRPLSTMDLAQWVGGAFVPGPIARDELHRMTGGVVDRDSWRVRV